MCHYYVTSRLLVCIESRRCLIADDSIAYRSVCLRFICSRDVHVDGGNLSRNDMQGRREVVKSEEARRSETRSAEAGVDRVIEEGQLAPSPAAWYRPRGGDALRLGR